MSDDHSTRRPETGSYEPTQYAKNPYETTAPYDVPPILPPPPPNDKRSWWHIAVPILMVVALVALILVPTIALSKQPAHTPATHFDPGGTAAAQLGATQRAADTATASVPTPTPTQNTSYTANDIVQAFQADGLPTDDLSYGRDVFREVGITNMPAQSSADFNDPSLCGGYHCGEGSVFLEVYATAIDAETVEQQFDHWVTSSTMPFTSYRFQAGRCVLVGEPMTSAYAQIVKSDCI